MKRILIVAIVTCITLVLTACKSPAPTPTEPPPPPPTDTPVPPPPTATLEPTATPDPLLFRDDFDGKLAEGWSWTNEDDRYYSFTNNPGWLEMSAQPGYIGGTVKNLLLRPAPEGNYELETKVNFTPEGNFQIAALVIYESGPNFVQFGRAFCGPCPAKDGFYFDLFVDGKFGGENFATPITGTDTVSLRLRREGSSYTGYASLDGTNWQVIGTHQSPMTAGFVGLTAAQATDTEPGPAQFDYFTITALP